MSRQCLAAGLGPFVVMEEEKAFCCRGLTSHDAEPGYLRQTPRHFQDAYAESVERLVPPGPAGE